MIIFSFKNKILLEQPKNLFIKCMLQTWKVKAKGKIHLQQQIVCLPDLSFTHIPEEMKEWWYILKRNTEKFNWVTNLGRGKEGGSGQVLGKQKQKTNRLYMSLEDIYRGREPQTPMEPDGQSLVGTGIYSQFRLPLPSTMSPGKQSC